MIIKKTILSKLSAVKSFCQNHQSDATITNLPISSGHDGKLATSDNEADSGLWMEQNYEGQLSVDVYQTADEIIIKSAVAGVNPNDLDISINNDMITIRGRRYQSEKVSKENYFYQECYWGSFARSIILPQEIEVDKASAEFTKGILTIRLPKAQNIQQVHIKVYEEEN